VDHGEALGRLLIIGGAEGLADEGQGGEGLLGDRLAGDGLLAELVRELAQDRR
jgi:hypothetical protein